MSNPLQPHDHIADHKAFSALLSRLRADHAANGRAWENGTLGAFLKALEVT
ncbi:hypothetical protein ABT040_24500 [Streptomyces sp. NPDC002688]|uniref:hypothetical protein n=1 Tax=Streptomyces sp. NPDC002688 TaxID=3154423 RepID=UPI003324C24B